MVGRLECAEGMSAEHSSAAAGSAFASVRREFTTGPRPLRAQAAQWQPKPLALLGVAPSRAVGFPGTGVANGTSAATKGGPEGEGRE
jgi:hypothetical protein